jgi:FkbM family methyltransferase
MITFSQNFEDVMLSRVFNRKTDGFYIDIGAHDPDELSVTKHFYNLGWNGINIEPVPKSFNKFIKKRKRDINLNIAIGSVEEVREFYSVSGYLKSGLDASALSSFCKKNVFDAAREFDINYEAIEIKTKPLKEICDTYCKKPIDFIKIDVEGLETDVIKGADFINYRPTIVLIEATKPNSNPLNIHDLSEISTWDDYDKIIISSDYDFVYFDGLNRFYLKREASELKHLFSFPISSFDGFVRPERANIQAKYNKTKTENVKLIDDNDTLKERILILNNDNEKQSKRLIKLESIIGNKDSQLKNYAQIITDKNEQIDRLNIDIKNKDNRNRNVQKKLIDRVKLLHILIAETRFINNRNTRFTGSEIFMTLKMYFADIKSFIYIWLIRKSGLFFDNYYQKQVSKYTDSFQLPILHYFKNGFNSNANPNPFFSTSFYLKNNPDVVSANINPLFHYIRHGWKEGRNPHANFDSLWYLSNYQDVARAGINPLFHFLKHGIREGRLSKPTSTDKIDFDQEYFSDRIINNSRIVVHWGGGEKEVIKNNIFKKSDKYKKFKTKKNDKILKILTLCTYAYGGAGMGTLRRISALRNIDIDARLISLFSKSNEKYIGRIEPSLDGIRTNKQKEVHRFINQIYNHKIRNDPQYCARELFTPTDSLVTFSQLFPLIEKYDIMHLHWVAGLLDYHTMGQVVGSKPTAWTLADMNAFTGGCHYSEGCKNFENECQDCPLIGENKYLPHKTWRIKKQAYERMDKLAIICPSEWIANLARKSSLFKDRPVHVIPNAYPTDQFTPIDQIEARKKLCLPFDKKLVLFGADVSSNLRKGSDLLQKALKIYTSNTHNNLGDLEAVTFGKTPPLIDIPHHSLGSLNEDQLAHAYSAADVFLSCTREDVGPMTVGESMLCGTPVVGFRSVGILDEIGSHQYNVYMAEPFDPQDLARGISWALESRMNDKSLSEKCRESAEKYCDPILSANRHKSVYASLL